MIKEAAMTDVTDHNHDLEDHITTLRKLDEARRRSAELRDEGIEVLMEYLHLPKKKEEPPAFGDWRRERSLIVRALLTLQDQPFSDEEKEAKRLKLIKSLTNQLQKNFSLKALAENELSVLMAASVLQALTVRPGGAFSKTAMLCYYWIIRELYSANWSDWNIGGARAAPGGLVTAFTTGECVRALWSFAEAQRNTGKFIEEAGKYLERMKELENLNNVYFSAEKSSNPLEKWVKAEKKRLRLSCYLNLRRLSRYLVLPLDPSEIILCDPSIWSTDDDEQKKELIKQFLNKNTVLIVEVAKGTKWVIAWLDDKGEPKIKVVDEALIIKDVDEKLKEVEPDRDKIKQCLNLSDNKTITKIIKLAQFEDLLKAEIQKVKDDFSEALQKIREYRNGHCEVIGEKAEEILKDLEEYLYHDVLSTPSALEKNQYRDITRSESAHLIAAMAVKDASYRVQKALDIFGKDDKKVYGNLY
jgi:hypothetical protein